MKRGQRREMIVQTRGQSENKACAVAGSVQPAGNLSPSLTLSAYLRTVITYAISTQQERDGETEQASSHSADPSTSLEEITPTTGGFTLPKALTLQLFLFFFFCPAQHAIKQEGQRWHCLSDESVCCTSLCSFVDLTLYLLSLLWLVSLQSPLIHSHSTGISFCFPQISIKKTVIDFPRAAVSERHRI